MLLAKSEGIHSSIVSTSIVIVTCARVDATLVTRSKSTYCAVPSARLSYTALLHARREIGASIANSVAEFASIDTSIEVSQSWF